MRVREYSATKVYGSLELLTCAQNAAAPIPYCSRVARALREASQVYEMHLLLRSDNSLPAKVYLGPSPR
jgi:hypothetical protein